MEEEFKCAICLEMMEDPVTLCSNNHNFCHGCLDSYFNVRGRITCPLCRQRVDLRNAKELSLKKNHYLNNLIKYMEKNEKKFKEQEEEYKRRQESLVGTGPFPPVDEPPKDELGLGEDRGPYLKEVTYEEYEELSQYVLNNFHQSGSDGKVYQVIITRIEKFCNPILARNFHQTRERFRIKRRPFKSTRMMHGSTIAASKSISKEGFRVPTTNLRKDSEPYMFGKAIYFSPLTNKCTQYGKNMLIVADLALGRIYKTKSFKYKMEKKQLNSMGYESIHCLPNSQHTGGVEIEEVAIYTTEQVLPQYAITYQLVENKLDDIETYKIEKEYKNEESERLMKYIDSQKNLIKKFCDTLRGGNILEIERTVKMIGDLSKYKGSRFRLWYEVSQTPDIYCALRSLVMKCRNELVLWEGMRAIWGITYGNVNGQTKFLTYGESHEGERFLEKVFGLFKHHSNRTIKQRSAVLICNFSQQKANRDLIEKFDAVKMLFTVLKKEVKEARVDLKLVVNVIGALANLALSHWRKFSQNDKFFIEQLLNNRNLQKINEEIIRLLCNLVFEGKEDEEWSNSENKYVSEKSSEFF